MLTVERLKEVLRYNKRTGLFHWRVDRDDYRCKGKPAGSDKGNAGGHLVIRIDGVLYHAHRLAWLYVMGAWPAQKIDHKDGNGANNKFRNLRDATQRVNTENQRRAQAGSLSGLLGVSPCGTRWKAQIVVKGRNKSLGRFKDKHEAHRVYVAAKRQYHEGCTI